MMDKLFKKKRKNDKISINFINKKYGRRGIKMEKTKKELFQEIFGEENDQDKKISEELMREFSEELKPVGITCKNWSKNT